MLGVILETDAVWDLVFDAHMACEPESPLKCLFALAIAAC
jgi:hypothetical protein